MENVSDGRSKKMKNLLEHCFKKLDKLTLKVFDKKEKSALTFSKEKENKLHELCVKRSEILSLEYFLKKRV